MSVSENRSSFPGHALDCGWVSTPEVAKEIGGVLGRWRGRSAGAADRGRQATRVRSTRPRPLRSAAKQSASMAVPTMSAMIASALETGIAAR